MSHDRARDRETLRRWKAKQRAAGLCEDCAAPAFAGGSRCAFHKLINRIKYRKYGGFQQYDYAANREPPSHGRTKYMPDHELLIIASGLQ